MGRSRGRADAVGMASDLLSIFLAVAAFAAFLGAVELLERV
jgi:hypothetical protein